MIFPKLYSYARTFLNTATTLNTNITDQDFHTGKYKYLLIMQATIIGEKNPMKSVSWFHVSWHYDQVAVTELQIQILAWLVFLHFVHW